MKLKKKENKKEVSKTSQEKESLLLSHVKESSYKDTLTKQKKNAVIFGHSILKGINTRVLNKKLLKSKVYCKFFPGATSNDFVHYIKPTLQEMSVILQSYVWA